MSEDENRIVPSPPQGLVVRGSRLVSRGLDDLSQPVVVCADASVNARAERLENANRELAERVQDLEQRLREINLLSEMVNRLQTCMDAEEAFIQIVNAAEQLFPKWSGALCIIGPSRTAVETVAEWGESAGGERAFAPDDCRALRHGKIQSFRRGEEAAPCSHIDPMEVMESLCIPLFTSGGAFGIMSLQMRVSPNQQELTPRFSSDAERQLAVVLTQQVALGLGNFKLKETLRKQAICDPHTGLFNRRYMEESLEHEFSRANRKKSSVAIVMMDLDHFKRFNEEFGYEAGDALLRTLGDFLKQSMRNQDIACRHGGEDFALVLADSSLPGALRVAEKVREKVKQLSVEYESKFLSAGTVSMGVAVFPEHGTTPSDVLRASRHALRCAKREGRDRVFPYQPKNL